MWVSGAPDRLPRRDGWYRTVHINARIETADRNAYLAAAVIPVAK